MNNMVKSTVAHVFWDTAPYLAVNLVKNLKYPEDVVYAREMFEMTSNASGRSRNIDWTKDIAKGMYVGYLKQPSVLRRRAFSVHLSILLRLLFTDFSLRSWIMIIKGPRNWVLHGAVCSFTTMLLLRIIGKRIVLLHWGGMPSVGKYKGALDRGAYRLCNHLFVLISPELRYFSGFVGQSKLSVLPYPLVVGGLARRRTWAIENPRRWLLIGNNGLVMNSYSLVLDRIPAGSWEKIICMLNYGQSEDSPHMRNFIEKYKKKFGEAFVPWIKTIPIDEYLRYMENCCAYICPWEWQSGIGAAYVSIVQGKAVFLAGDNYEWMKSNGIYVSELGRLEDFSFTEISHHIPTEDMYENILEAVRKLSEQNTPQYWHKRLKEDFL